VSGDVVGPLESARAAVAARAAGPALAEVMLVAGADGGSVRRRLHWADGRARGSLGEPELDAAAADLAGTVLAGAPGGGAQVRELDTARGRVLLCAAVHCPADQLVIVGAGHISVPLAELGARLGFAVTVLDDRDEFAEAARFPAGTRVLRVDFDDPFGDVALGPRSHVVLVTRAHRYDFDCLRRLVEADVRPAYVGMIGSRRRVKAAFLALLGAGVSRERLRRVHAPLGLDIGAETPEEIAVAVAAELVLLRRRGAVGTVAALREAERVLDRLIPPTEEMRPDG
jgi:xanthine dehydrogenase accessory factor